MQTDKTQKAYEMCFWKKKLTLDSLRWNILKKYTVTDGSSVIGHCATIVFSVFYEIK